MQQRQGFLAALQALQQAGAQQYRGNLASLGRVFFEQVEGGLGLAILLQQQGLAEHQLTVVGVFHQQAIETVLQAGAGVRVGFER
ncbi:hypothetical protein D3C79_925630 [compost metagenome]